MLAYGSIMSVRQQITRRLVAALVALALAFVTEPPAVAMSMDHSAPMRAVAHISLGSTGYVRSMTKQDQGAPCSNGVLCPGMLNCLTPVVVPAAILASQPSEPPLERLWRVQESGPGITLQPDNPPPIA